MLCFTRYPVALSIVLSPAHSVWCLSSFRLEQRLHRLLYCGVSSKTKTGEKVSVMMIYTLRNVL